MITLWYPKSWISTIFSVFVTYHRLGIPSLSYNTSVYERAKYLYAVSVLVEKGRFLNGRMLYREIVDKLGRFFKFIEVHIRYTVSKPTM